MFVTEGMKPIDWHVAIFLGVATIIGLVYAIRFKKYRPWSGGMGTTAKIHPKTPVLSGSDAKAVPAD